MNTQQGARLQIRADQEMVKTIKRICVEREISMQDFVLEAVRTALEEAPPAVPPSEPRSS